MYRVHWRRRGAGSSETLRRKDEEEYMTKHEVFEESAGARRAKPGRPQDGLT